MSEFELSLKDEAATLQLGAALAKAFAGQGRIYLSGDLGAGKTTLCRGLLRAMGHQGAVKSPTFTLVEPYDMDAAHTSGGQVFHFDLYRLNDPDELEYIGFDEYFAADNLCLVEWPEKAQGRLPDPDIDLALVVEGRSRRATLKSATDKGREANRTVKEFLAGK